jgi:hypothetical protein
MGYSIDFIIPELDSKFKTTSSLKFITNNVEKYKIILTTFCMQKHSNLSYEELYQQVLRNIELYVGWLKEKWKSEIQSLIEEDNEYSPKNEISFYGWEFAKNSISNNHWDFDEKQFYRSINYTLENLLLACTVIPTINYFDDSDRFYEKIKYIHDELECIKDTVENFMYYEFLNFYENNEKKYSENIEKEIKTDDEQRID